MIALVTGGSGGLGSMICETLADQGSAVAVGCLSNRPVADATVDRIQARGARALTLPFDVTNMEAVKSAIDTVVATFGGLDVIILAAARSTSSLLVGMAPAKAAELHAVNVGGVMNCVAAALPHLMASEQGRVVTFSSVVARSASAGMAGYASTKGAVESLTRALAVELGPKRVTVNAVAPGYIAAGLGKEPAAASADWIRQFLPLRRAGDATDVAAAVSFLVSAEAAYVTGTILRVDGGLLAGSRSHARWSEDKTGKVAQ